MFINNIIARPEYNFLRSNEHLGDHIMFIVTGGSHAYGTNTETSDIDIRGCTLPMESDLLGLTSFEQFADTTTDTIVYSTAKLIPLLAKCNPFCLELLGGRPEDYALVSHAGKLLLENRKLFLSKKAIPAYNGLIARMESELHQKLRTGKDDLHINKHLMHIIRFCFVLRDILEKEEVINYREQEHDLLMEIRDGAFFGPDKVVKPEFFEVYADVKNQVCEAAEKTHLPEKADMTTINNLAIKIHRMACKGGLVQ